MGRNDWALVELYRWQHGQLPPQDDTAKSLDIPKALEAMAVAMDPTAEKMPKPFNVGQVLAFAGRKIAELEAEGTTLREAIRETIAAIKIFHGEPGWELYAANSPEMKRWRAMLSQ